MDNLIQIFTKALFFFDLNANGSELHLKTTAESVDFDFYVFRFERILLVFVSRNSSNIKNQTIIEQRTM